VLALPIGRVVQHNKLAPLIGGVVQQNKLFTCMLQCSSYVCGSAGAVGRVSSYTLCCPVLTGVPIPCCRSSEAHPAAPISHRPADIFNVSLHRHGKDVRVTKQL